MSYGLLDSTLYNLKHFRPNYRFLGLFKVFFVSAMSGFVFVIHCFTQDGLWDHSAQLE